MDKKYLNVKTVIIGSGVAGIACGINLLKNNYNDFMTFEALDRIGGRVYSIDYQDTFLEMGAQFIHGQENNPIYYIARDNKQIEDKYLNILDDDDESFVDYSGIPVNFDENLFLNEKGEKLDPKFVNEIYQITSKVIEMNEQSLDKNDISLAQSMLDNFNQIVDKNFPKNQDLRQLIDGLFIWRSKCENIENGCSSITKLSANNFVTWQELKGSQIIELKYGYNKIINLILKDYYDTYYSKLHLRHLLKQILVCTSQFNCCHCKYINDSNKLVLLIKNLDQNEDLIVICSNVLITSSLGYLKENLTKLIQPASIIPNEKLTAIERVGYGTVNKIFLIYDKPFWELNVTSFHPIWFLKEKQTIISKLDEINESNWFENIPYFDIVKNHENILCAWLSGCEFVENFTDEKIARDCTILFRKFFRDESIPEPKKVIKSTWHSNEYFKGSYSNLPLNSKATDFTDIQKPIEINNKPVIMFAGEATIAEYYSTVHGAYFSGIRESERILNL